MKPTILLLAGLTILVLSHATAAEDNFRAACAMDLADDYVTPLTITDLEGDGRLEVLAGTADRGLLYRLSYDGSPCIASWEPTWSYLARGNVRTIDVANIEGGSDLEIVIPGGLAKFSQRQSDGYVFVVKADGLKSWKEDELGGYTLAAVAANLDADRELEIVVGAKNSKVTAYNAKKERLWDYATDHPVYAVAAADLEGDGTTEIVALSYRYGTATVDIIDNEGTEKGSYDVAGGVYTGGVHDPLAVADLDADGTMEILVGSMDHGVDAITPQGAVKWNFPLSDLVSAIEVADLAGDGDMDVVVGAKPGLYILDAQGSLQTQYQGIEHTINDLAAGDLTGDGNPEIVAGTIAEVLAFDDDALAVGSWEYSSQGTQTPARSVAVGDLDGDGIDEVVVAIGWTEQRVMTTSAFGRVIVLEPDIKKAAPLTTVPKTTVEQSTAPATSITTTVDIDEGADEPPAEDEEGGGSLCLPFLPGILLVGISAALGIPYALVKRDT